jgi:hypothetical protein
MALFDRLVGRREPENSSYFKIGIHAFVGDMLDLVSENGNLTDIAVVVGRYGLDSTEAQEAADLKDLFESKNALETVHMFWLILLAEEGRLSGQYDSLTDVLTRLNKEANKA